MLRLMTIFLALNASASEPAIILGVLEEIPGSYVGDPPHRAIRVAFQKQGREWQPASEYPPSVTWTIAFSGRNLSQLAASNSTDDLQSITSKEPIPTIGKRSEQFAGFLGTPVLRPLIAISQPTFKDPDAWKPHPPPELTAPLRLAFRKKFPNVSNCATSNDDPKPWPYRDTDIKLTKAYASNKGWSAVQVRLTGNRCEGPEDDPFYDQWFAVTPRGEIIFLGQGMWLVDAGDYDNDGKSELVFAINRYNQGGYEIFYDDFQGHAVLHFSYH